MKDYGLIKSKLKKKFIGTAIPLILITVLIAVTVFIASDNNKPKYSNITSNDYDLSGDYSVIDAAECSYSEFLPVAQNARFTMYFNSSTTAVAVHDKKTGRTVTSLVPEEEINRANPYNEDARYGMLSNFVLTAVDMKSGNTKDYTMYDALNSNGKYTVQSIENGIRVTYLIGKIPETYTVPSALSEKRYREIVNSLSKSDAIIFENRYMLLNISDYFGSEKKEYLEKYPDCNKKNIYILNSDKKFILQELEEVLAKINYTDEQKEKDESEVTAGSIAEEYPIFKIPLDFSLNEDNFSISIQKEDIRYNDTSLPVYIQLCPYLMRAYKDNNGYMLMPDGTGSVINLNNGKINAETYSADVYGKDPLFYDNFTKQDTPDVLLPFYGLKSDGGILAYISGSAEDAQIRADISGKNSDTNYACTRFKIFGYKKEMVSQDWTSTGNGTIYNIRILGDKVSGKSEVCYYLLPENSCEYSDMAQACKEILTEKGFLSKNGTENSNTALVNLLGSYDYKKSVLGIAVDSDIIMTDFDAASQIVNSFADKKTGVDLRYLAAVNGGYIQTVADDIDFVSGLGTKKQFKALKSAVEKNSGKLYFDLSFTKIYKNGIFDGFNVSKDSAAKITTEHKPFFDWDPVSFYYVKKAHYYLSPTCFEANMRKVLKASDKLGVNAISFRSIGSVLYSDADTKRFADRTEVSNRFAAAANTASQKGVSLMYNAAGAYVFNTASYIASAPSNSGEYALTDAQLPFYQMIIHGKIPYTYGALLNSSDINRLLLYTAATGAKLQFNVSGKSSSELKLTDYSKYYNTSWSDNGEKILNYCDFLSEVTAKTFDKEFISFMYIANDVTESVFSGGVTVYTNFSDKDYNLKDGTTVSSGSYIVLQN